VSFSRKKYLSKKSFAQGYPQGNPLKYEYVDNYFFLRLDHLATSLRIGDRFDDITRKRMVFTPKKDNAFREFRASANLLKDFSCGAKYQSRPFREFREGLTPWPNPC
jgi:hypothetical protein